MRYAVLQFCSRAVKKNHGFMNTIFSSHPGPRTTHLLEAVAETDHEIEHLGGIISPFIIAVPGYIVYFNPERKDFCIAVFSTQSKIEMYRLLRSMKAPASSIRWGSVMIAELSFARSQ